MAHATALQQADDTGPYAGLNPTDLLDLAQRAARAVSSSGGVLPAAGPERAGLDPGPSVGLRPGLVVSTNEVERLWREVARRSREGDGDAAGVLCALVADSAQLAPTGLSRPVALDAIADPVLRRRTVAELHLTTPALVALRSGVPAGALRQTVDELLITEAERTREPALVRLLQRSAVVAVANRAHMVEGANLLASLEELRRRPADGTHLGAALETMAQARLGLERWGERMGTADLGPEQAQRVAELRTKGNEVGRAVRDALGHRVLADLDDLHTRPVTHLPTWEVKRSRAVTNARYWLDAGTPGPSQAQVQQLLAREVADAGAWGRRSALAVRRAQQRVRAAKEWWEMIGLLAAVPMVAGLLLLRLVALGPALGAVAAVAMFGLAQRHRRILRHPEAWVAYYVPPPAPRDG